MANKAISELPQALNVNNQDLFVLEQGGIAKKLTAETFITEQGIIDALAEALDGHGGIQSVTLASVSGRIRTYRITFSDGSATTFQVYDGTSIDRIVKTSTAGLVDTYTVFMSDGTTTFFSVTNGADGEVSSSSIATTFDPATSYTKGNYVWYGGQLYVFTSDRDVGAWDQSDVESVAIGNELSDLKSAISDENNIPIKSLGLKNAVDAALNNTDLEKEINMSFYDGEIHSGTPQADSRRCYSELIDNVFGKEIYFDDTKFKALLVFFSSDESSHTYGAYDSSSPVKSSTFVTSYPKMRVELQTKDDSNINKSQAENTTYYLEEVQNKNINVRYVSTSGSDNNDGTKTNPFATVNKALESGAEIIYLASGRYFQQIDLSKARKGIVDLRKSDNANVYFSPVADRKIVTSETLVSGKTKTYQATISVSINENNKWLYQEGIEDASTAISASERLPQQRGLSYRCANTLIKKCASNNATDAIAEIETSDDYLWYLDGTILYFSRPSTISGSHPISYSDGSTLFINNSRDVTIRMEGIICEFMAINLDYSVGSVIRDCCAGYVFGSGAITYDYAQAVQIIRCEALRCNNGNQGDGINGHADTSTGGIKTRRTTAVILDCWSHDNRDDGFSDHQGCESTIIGGLFEYNGKGGVTPSYGAHCVAHDVISRYNFNGFYYTGQSADEGNNGQLECFSCIAENNNGGTSQVNAGFVIDSAGNTMTLIGCKSIGNKIGYYAPTDTQMRLYDCTATDCEQDAAGKTRMTIKNGTVIAP